MASSSNYRSSTKKRLKQSNITKIYQHIANGKLEHLCSYIKHRGIEIGRVPFSKNRNAMHIACKYQQKEIVRYLLIHNVDLLQQDQNGNVPLLTSLSKTFVKTGKGRPNKIENLLISACRTSLKIRNREGICAQDILSLNKKKKKKKTIYVEVTSSDSSDTNSDSFTDSDSSSSSDSSFFNDDFTRDWYEKIEAEMESGYYQEFGKFEADFSFEFQFESHDDWADRMQREYNAKQNRSSHSHYKKPPQEPEEPKHRPNLKPQNEDFERVRLNLKSKRYLDQCRELFESENSEVIKLKNIPVPDGSFIKTLLNFETDEATKRNFLRKQQIRWHPDKFVQKCGQRLLQTERQAILERVNQISQLVNSYLDSMS